MRFLKQKREALAIGKGFFFFHNPVHFSGKQRNIFTELLREPPNQGDFLIITTVPPDFLQIYRLK